MRVPCNQSPIKGLFNDVQELERVIADLQAQGGVDLSGYALVDHTHDPPDLSGYVTDAELAAGLSGKANVFHGHFHGSMGVCNLQDENYTLGSWQQVLLPNYDTYNGPGPVKVGNTIVIAISGLHRLNFRVGFTSATAGNHWAAIRNQTTGDWLALENRRNHTQLNCSLFTEQYLSQGDVIEGMVYPSQDITVQATERHSPYLFVVESFIRV